MADARSAPDQAADFAEQVRAVEPFLRNWARRAVGEAHLVDDLVQDTLLAAVSQRTAFAGRSQLRTWLVGILSHKVMDHFRRSSREPLSEAEPDEDVLLAAPTRSPHAVLEHKRAIAALERALPTLPHLERLAVLMIDVTGLEQAEACNALSVKPTHLRVLLHRGRHRLRKVLEDERGV